MSKSSMFFIRDLLEREMAFSASAAVTFSGRTTETSSFISGNFGRGMYLCSRRPAATN